MPLNIDHAQGLVDEALDPLRYRGQTPDPDESPSILAALIPHGSRVLDVGCGIGAISKLIAESRQAQVVGLEPQPERAGVAREAGLEVIEAPFGAEAVAGLGQFDAVVFADVLEHLSAPAEALELAKTLLRPGGCIAASVPNVAHWSVRFDLLLGRFNYRDRGIMDATHLRWFTSQSLTRLFESAGLRVESIAGSAGLWMSEYEQRWPWRWLGAGLRKRIVLHGVRRWPGLFACQFVVKATPQ